MKILIADDHPIFRSGLRAVVSQLDDTIKVIEAENHTQAFDSIAAHGDFALVLYDLGMPDTDGLAAMARLIVRYPALPVVVLSASDDRGDMQSALDHGAVGYIEKSTPPAVMLSALRLVLSGGIYVPPTLVRQSQSMQAGDQLTQRQSEVLAGVVEGKSNKVIAAELGLSEATVKAHITALFKRLNVANRTQAALALRTASRT